MNHRHVNGIRYSMALFAFWAFLTAGFARAEDGVTDQEILLGTTTNVSGANAVRANGAQGGAKLYFDKINAEGGINGRKIRVVLLDDKYKPELAAENAEKLIGKDKVFAIFQPYGTPPAKAIIPKIEHGDIPMLFPFTGANFLSYPANRNIYNVRARYGNEATTMVEFGQKKGWKTYALATQDDSGGSDMSNGFHKALAQLNGGRALEGRFSKEPGASYDVPIAAAFKTEPEVLVMAGLAPASMHFLDAVLAKGHHPAVFCFSPCVSDQFPADVKGKFKDFYVFQSAPPLSNTHIPIVSEYLAAAKASGHEPSPTGVEGFMHAKLTVEAMRKAGKDLTRQAFRQALDTQFKDYDLGGLKISFSASDHQGLKRAQIYHLEGDKLVEVK